MLQFKVVVGMLLHVGSSTTEKSQLPPIQLSQEQFLQLKLSCHSTAQTCKAVTNISTLNHLPDIESCCCPESPQKLLDLYPDVSCAHSRHCEFVCCGASNPCGGQCCAADEICGSPLSGLGNHCCVNPLSADPSCCAYGVGRNCEDLSLCCLDSESNSLCEPYCPVLPMGRWPRLLGRVGMLMLSLTGLVLGITGICAAADYVHGKLGKRKTTLGRKKRRGPDSYHPMQGVTENYTSGVYGELASSSASVAD